MTKPFPENRVWNETSLRIHLPLLWKHQTLLHSSDTPETLKKQGVFDTQNDIPYGFLGLFKQFLESQNPTEKKPPQFPIESKDFREGFFWEGTPRKTNMSPKKGPFQ